MQSDDSSFESAPSGELMQFEQWLNLIARLEIDNHYQGKFSRSDVVQQTMMEAWRNWDQFDGGDDPQRRRMAWLRRILANQLATLARRYGGAQKRDVSREVSIDESLARTSLRLATMLPANTSSPSAKMQRRERELELAEMLSRLPDDYREVIVLRNLEELSHAEVAEKMGRSEGAVRMLWLRALTELKKSIEQDRKPDA